MSQKRTASSSKRKAESDSNSDGVKPVESKNAKKAKVTVSDVAEDNGGGLAPNGQPTNKVLPVKISFPPRAEDTSRIVSWNICGLASSQKKGFKYYVEAEDPDILILTETKVNDEPADLALASRFPYRYWSISEKKTYSGTAILSKHKPLSVDKTLPGHPDPKSIKGRIVTLEFEGYYVVGTYVVNAGQGLKTLEAKKTWNHHFEAYIRDLDRKKPVMWAGDLNVAPTAIGTSTPAVVGLYLTSSDLSNPKTNWNKSAGYTEAETSAFARILNPPNCDAGKLVDVWRKLHPDDHHYTYFSYRFNCRAKGIGWRLDAFVLSERIVDRVKTCEIRSEIYGASDHCPIVLEIAPADVS
ncbi:Endonuclease/exonuclease/phosphatase [Multifurca ochricompacta]|uniref:DNA-(apurinic or apyrimidinic site) endonuclease n=1 Tax=Multifurca ochricompacta TaxID=376703 RepID=A0AAD4M9L2_9AGAM|nr:Endonuclease/exonuclease/phosphatase [Multifurca ochricompacta]